MSHRSKRSVRVRLCKICGNRRYALEGERMVPCPYTALHKKVDRVAKDGV